MLLFFVTIGAAAGSLGALLQTGWLAGFIMLQLGVHMAFTLGVGRLFHLPMEVRYTRSITRTCHIGMCVGWPIYAEGGSTPLGDSSMVMLDCPSLPRQLLWCIQR